MEDYSIWRREFLAPRYWPTWGLIALIRSFANAPNTVQRPIGKTVGALLYGLLGRRRHIARVNLKLCFPELTDREREALVFRHFQSLGLALSELGMSWWASEDRVRGLVTTTGLENLHGALAKGKGAILLGAHFTTLDLGLRFLLLFHPCHMMYRPANNRLLENLVQGARARHARVFPRDDVRTMLRSLKQNMPVWYAPDQNYSGRHSVFVDFFNQPASTITTTSRFARISGAPVVPFFLHRLPGSAGYELVLLPPLENFPSGDDAADARRINEILEEQIRRSPEQYLWLHRRFKRRPDPAENVYAT